MSYPVTFEADYVERRNRLSTFFRLILAIPLLIWGYVYGDPGGDRGDLSRGSRSSSPAATRGGCTNSRPGGCAFSRPADRLRGAAV